MNSKLILIYFIIISFFIVAYGSEEKKEVQAFQPGSISKNKKSSKKGKVTIRLNNKTYNIPLLKCFRKKGTNKDKKDFEIFSVATYKSVSTAPEPTFVTTGLKMEEIQGTSFKQSYANFIFTLDGGTMSGGTEYVGEMPIDIFKDNEINFKGKTEIRKKSTDGLRIDKNEGTIEFLAKCYK